MDPGPPVPASPAPDAPGDPVAALADVLPMPTLGEVVADPRGGGRWLRVTWHHEADVVVLSLWREDTCVGTARVGRADVPALVQALVGGLADDAASARSRRRAAEPR